MNIDPKSLIAGHPAVEIRNLMRKLQGFGLFSKVIPGEIMSIPESAGQRLMATLIELGYIEWEEKPKPAKYYNLTVQGNALANASAARPVLRATAEKKLSEFLNRVKEINKDPYWLYSVPEVRLFGSMLGDAERVSDVDLALDLQQKKETTPEALRNRIHEAISQGRQFPNLAQEILWPIAEVYRHLKGRSPVISICDLNTPKELGVAFRTIYRAGE